MTLLAVIKICSLCALSVHTDLCEKEVFIMAFMTVIINNLFTRPLGNAGEYDYLNLYNMVLLGDILTDLLMLYTILHVFYMNKL